MARPHSTRKPLLAIALTVLAVGLAWIGWTAGRVRSAAVNGSGPPPTTNQRVVAGASMAPTLLGPSCSALCKVCNLTWSLDPVAADLPPHRLLCSHCGQTMSLQQPTATAPDSADRVEVQSLGSDRRLFRGQLVAVRPVGAKPFIKRVVALPDDTVDIDPKGRHLLVNGQRIEDTLFSRSEILPLPRFLVDRDRSRAESRWASAPQAWTRDAQRGWHLDPASDAGWLVYGHQSVYDGNQPSGVLDDYPYNVAAQRRLQPVDRLFLSGHCQSQTPATIQVAFWSETETLIASVDVDRDSDFSVSCYDAVASTGGPLAPPVRETCPVAIRVQGQSVTLSALVVERLVQYRLRPTDDRTVYPLKLGPGQLFVLGDNVPVSVDSRDYGCVRDDEIEGTVLLRSHSSRQ
jgi:type IV secretory pathway protease TraF